MVEPARSTVERCQGRTKRKSPDQATSATFWRTTERPTVVKICTLWEAWMTPRMTST